MSNLINVEIPEVSIPNPAPEVPRFDWITYMGKQDIDDAVKALDSVKEMVSDLRRKYTNAAREVESLRSSNWKDEQLQSMKKAMQQAIEDSNRGFPITQSQLESIHKWEEKHDTEVHNNPNQYHGASGGGYEYVFYPTGIGTAGDCICSTCKHRAIKEYGEKWYEHCQEIGGIFEFQQLG